MFFPADLTNLAPDERLRVLATNDRVAEAASALAHGSQVIVVDEAAFGGRGRGFFLQAAALATAETVNQAILWGRGITYFSVTPEQAMRLGLLMAGEYRDGYRGPIALRSVEAAICQGTGISAADRAETLRAAGAPDAGMASLKSPGHVIPVMIAYRGREHRAVADIALDLLRHLTTHEVAAWTDILDDDGEVAPAAHCQALADRLGLVCLGIADSFGAGALDGTV
jgi:3,4-dihydroxy 2-butanone 4-phosphate synthase/GTP cyclohydrolase II